VYWTNLSKFQAFYEILNFNLVILTKILRKNWPLFGLFFIFQDMAFLKLLMAKFGLFNFFDLATLQWRATWQELSRVTGDMLEEEGVLMNSKDSRIEGI